MHVLVKDTTLRLGPSDDRQVQHPHAPDLMIDNFVGQVSKGRRGRVRRLIPGWSEVKLDDDAEGWVHTNALMPVANARDATVLEECPLRAGPSDDAPPAGIVHPGTLFFVTEPGPRYSKIYTEPYGFVYLANRFINSDPQEIAVSRLLIHTRLAARMHDMDEALDALDVARVKYPSSPLINIIAENVDFIRMRPEPRSHSSRLHLP